MNTLASRIAQAEQLAKDTAAVLESIRPARVNTPLEELSGSEREAVEGWFKDVNLMLTHVDFIRNAKNEQAPIDARERDLDHAEGGLSMLKVLVEEYKRTGKTLLERLTPPRK